MLVELRSLANASSAEDPRPVVELSSEDCSAVSQVTNLLVGLLSSHRIVAGPPFRAERARNNSTRRRSGAGPGGAGDGDAADDERDQPGGAGRGNGEPSGSRPVVGGGGASGLSMPTMTNAGLDFSDVGPKSEHREKISQSISTDSADSLLDPDKDVADKKWLQDNGQVLQEILEEEIDISNDMIISSSDDDSHKKAILPHDAKNVSK